MLADTSYLIDLMQDDEAAKAKAEELVSESVPVMVGTPTIFELYVGVGLAIKSSEERERVLDVIRALTQLPLDASAATRAGIVYAQKVRDGARNRRGRRHDCRHRPREPADAAYEKREALRRDSWP